MIGERGLVVKARFRFCLLLSAAALAAVAALVFFGVLPLNAPPEDRYPVRGVDVSAHQGVIDWPMLAAQGVEFAFIKATEGSGFTDARFSFNVLQARNAGLRVGAYHFFSFESSGDAQADNFIAVVEPFAGMLPPVVDLEYYAGFFDDPPAAEPVRAELDALLERLRAHYGVQPILRHRGVVCALYRRRSRICGAGRLDSQRVPASALGGLDLLAVFQPRAAGRLRRRRALYRPQRFLRLSGRI